MNSIIENVGNLLQEDIVSEADYPQGGIEEAESLIDDLTDALEIQHHKAKKINYTLKRLNEKDLINTQLFRQFESELLGIQDLIEQASDRAENLLVDFGTGTTLKSQI